MPRGSCPSCGPSRGHDLHWALVPPGKVWADLEREGRFEEVGQTRTQDEDAGRATPKARAPVSQEEPRRRRQRGEGSCATELWVVRYVSPGGLLRLKSFEEVPGGLVSRELKTRRDAIEVHVESRQEVWSPAGM